MKIMVVNNNVMYENGEKLLLFKETGKFFVELSDIGNDVIVFQYRMKLDNNDFLSNFNINNRGLKVVSVKRRKSKIWAYIKAFIIGFNTVRKVDFVYLFYPGKICAVLAVFSLILGKRYGFYVRGEQGIMSPISRYLYKKADAVFTISPKFTSVINDSGAKTYTIRPMMEFTESDIVLNRVYKKKVKYELLFVGRIERAKGIFELLDAVKNLIRNGIQNFKLNLVGDGVDIDIIKMMIEEFELSEYIQLHGTVTDRNVLSSFYKKADVFIFPSHHEGFPRVLYEAMIFGTPIITSFVGTISYLMKDNYNCIKVESKNSVDLYSKILEFLKGYEQNSHIAIKSTQTIIDYLSDKEDNHANQLNKVINKIP